MRTSYFLFFVCIFFLIIFKSNAQQTAYFDNIQQEIDIAKELFQNEKYIASFRAFEKIQPKVSQKSELYSEAEFFKSIAALRAGYTSGNKLMKNFVDNFPESPYINRAWLNLGDYQFERKQYMAVVRTFQNVDRSDLSEKEKVKLQYQNGYANLMEENIDQAKKEFYEIKDANNMYSKPATYYWAHIMYLEEKYQSALEGFTKLNNDPNYSRVIPLYVSHIYYKQQKYTEVVNYTTSIIDDVEEEHKTELSKIVGDSYFHLDEYEKAIPFLETYFENTELRTREDNYILGYCYYSTGKYAESVPLFQQASKGNDEMAQNSYYHLADSHIKTDNKEKAKTAYQAASKLEFNERIQEDALFNFAKLTYELSYSPFNETIKAFDEYITKYPNSERNAEAYRILTEVYMVTKNYNDAITSIEKIKTKTPTILQAYQRVTFYRGLELFNNLAYNQAIDFFDLSLENESHSREFKARALFWKAEALSRVGDYNSSINTYNKFSTTAGASSIPEYNDAEYNLAYSYFKIEDYESAVSHFRKYISTNSRRTAKRADALNRIGDYYFLNTNYQRALQYYQESYSLKIYDADYALFQIAFCQGLKRNQAEKTENLEKLLAGFPESDYQDDALYELGRAYERLGQGNKAAQQYNKIVQNHSGSNFYSRALLQLGLINYNNGDFNEALKQYKEVAENYKGTAEARTALLGIKNCYVEQNNVNAYFAYTRSLGEGANITVSEQDSLTYIAAERSYMSGNTNASTQLENYLRQFPNGSFATNAHFYLAESNYKEAKYSLANEHYTYVANQPNNIFSEQALSRSSELTFNAEKYPESLEMFNRLENLANSKWNVLKANTGQMRCNLILKNYQAAIEAAEKISKSDIANEALTREASYTSGKSYYLLENFASALDGLKKVASDTKFEQGSEAKFLISEIYYRQNKKDLAEKEIMDFINKGTPYQFWLGKAFLLLADVYIDKKDEFQAKHTLKSVVDNYGDETDGVKNEAKRKLAKIESKEQLQEKSARDSSFQIQIKEN